MHEECLVADGVLGAEHRMTEAERHSLAHENARRLRRNDVAHQRQQVVFTGFGELALELGVGIEMVLDGAFR